MPAAYVSLSQSEADSEERLLVKSTEDYTSFNAQTPSPKLMLIAYVLFALTIFFAGTNVAAGIKACRTIQSRHTPIDQLPQPNIFVGLPAKAQTGKHAMPNMKPEHGHTHSHEHSHEH